MLHSLFKTLSRERAKQIQVGCEIDSVDGRLDTLFKYPNEQVAHAKLMDKFRSFLTVRYRNQRDFELDGPSDSEDAFDTTEATASNSVSASAVED